jgi:hypothetical protein
MRHTSRQLITFIAILSATGAFTACRSTPGDASQGQGSAGVTGTGTAGTGAAGSSAGGVGSDAGVPASSAGIGGTPDGGTIAAGTPDAAFTLDGRPPIRPDFGVTTDPTHPPPPVSGGTLAVLAGSQLAVAADPDRDHVYVVDLAA